MQLITVQFDDAALAQPIASAIKNAAPGVSIQHFCGVPTPVASAPAADSVDPELVAQVVKVVRDAPQRHVLQSLLYGDDTWRMSRGDANSIRPETIALSRRLKAVFPHLASPIDALVVRQREYFKEGGYKGIRYIPTPLAVAVREALKSEKDA
ncbi:hypothetical protein ABIE85_008364 [Bradyrhizobium diazoefficiens]|jgi:hypothetical protein|uniref:hypothetical protein n=1 Tax=Bradyrhizobium diazoefficiens TaxID=1355477 RepID=UPI00272D8326|nr:hypothetical protein [Bradyrhizobium diazoefficiens]WLA58533.1 hypothetical protein QIH81_07690 [Bradyrhizobium diazoefficiens]